MRNSTIIAALLGATAAARGARAQAPAQPLDTVRITVASRAGAAADVAHSASVITRDDIERTAARSIDDVLALALGVDVRARSVASADVALRGASSEGVVVLVDGVRVSDQQSGHFDLDLAVPLDDVERIEILRGTASALHGADAVGGVINIVTRSSSTTGLGSVEASGGSFGTGSVSARGGARAGSTTITAAFDGSKSDGHRPGTDYRVSQLRLGAARPLGDGTLRVDAGTGVRHFGAADFYGPYPAYEDTRSSTADARWDGDVAPGWSLSLDASTRRHGDLFTLVRDDPSLYQNRHVSWQSGGDASVRRVVSDALTIAAGVDGEELRLRSARLGNRDLTRGGAFTEAMIGRAGGAVLDATVRVERSSVDGTQGAPSIAAAIPVGVATVRLSASRGYRAPTWTERYYMDPANYGNRELRPETFWSGEAGARVALPARLSFDGDVFVRDARDVIDWAKPVGADGSTPWRTMNVDRATFRGVEAELDAHSLLGGAWSARATGVRFEAASAGGLVGKYALSPITRSFSLSATYPWKALRVSVDGMTAERAGADDERAVNARLAVPVPGERAVELHVDLLNLTNAAYRDVSGAPAAGRAAYAGLRWSAR